MEMRLFPKFRPKLNITNFKFTVFRKASNTGRLLDYESYSPDIHKRNVVKSLVQRALKICSDSELNEELDFITETLKKNGFPKKLIKNQIEKLRRQENSSAPLQT